MIRFEVNEVLPRLLNVAAVVNQKNVMRILTTLRLETTKDGNVCLLSITATDGNTMLTSKVGIDGESEPCSFCVDAKDFVQALRSLPNETISIEIEQGTMCARYKNGHFELPCENSAEYPSQIELKADESLSFSLPAALLGDAISATSFSMADDELRPQFCGIYVHLLKDKINFVSTDTKTLSRFKIDASTNVEDDNGQGFILPAAAVNTVSRLLGGQPEKDIKIEFDNSAVTFNGDDFILSARTVKGVFPNYERIIPKDYDKSVKVKKELLINALKRAALFTCVNFSIAELTFSQGNIEIVSSFIDFNKRFTESVDSESMFGGEPLRIGFSCKAVIGALKSIVGESAVIEVQSREKPAIFKVAEQQQGVEHTIIVMPVMINDV